MSVYGYARVSTLDQSLDVQLASLKKAGAEMVYAEQLTGRTVLGRDELEKCLAGLKRGDVLMVTKIDRVARSMKDLCDIMSSLDTRGVGFRCVDQAIDTTTLTGRLLLNVLGAFAEFEVGMIAERRAEGIRRAQLAGKYIGRPRQTQMVEARRLRVEEGLSAVQIAGRLSAAGTPVSVRSVYQFTRGMWGEQWASRQTKEAA